MKPSYFLLPFLLFFFVCMPGHVFGASSAREAASDVYYCWNFMGTSGNPDFDLGSVYITLDGDEVTIFGLFDATDVKGTLDSQAGSIRIFPQETIWKYQGEKIWLYTYKLLVDTETNQILGEYEVPYIEFKYAPSGATLSDGKKVCVGGWFADPELEMIFTTPSRKGTDSGWKWCYFNLLRPVQEIYTGATSFKYSPSEWVDFGTALFTDGWFSSLSDQIINPYSLSCERSLDGSKLLLKNPYGSNTSYSTFNDLSSEPGHIILDISDPDCVLALPFVSSGFGSAERFHTPFPFAATNLEGSMFYLEGKSKAEIKASMIGEWKTISTLNQAGLITLPNCRVQYPEDMAHAVQWTDDFRDPIPMISTIYVPAADINAILPDPDSTSVSYFDLQGRRIPAPTPGQPTIIRQGPVTRLSLFR